MPKNKKINIPQTDDHRKAMQWCIKNNITVGVLPTKKGLKVEINENGDNKVSPKMLIIGTPIWMTILEKQI